MKNMNELLDEVFEEIPKEVLTVEEQSKMINDLEKEEKAKKKPKKKVKSIPVRRMR